MTDQQWDDFEPGKDVPEPASLMADNSNEQKSVSSSAGKSRLTELRRRIEERQDSKRIALECDYLLLEDFDLTSDQEPGSDSLQ